MFYPEELVEEVRQRNDIVDVISSYVKLQKKGSSHMGLCPFHGEKTPSFSVSRSRQIYHCFGCGVGGNVFTFVMEYENYSFVEALKMLAERAGVSLPEGDFSEEEKRKSDARGRLLEINKAAAKYFFCQLKSERGKAAYGYLKGRELSDETIVKFGLGYSNKYSDDLYQYLKSLGYGDGILKESGLVTLDEAKGGFDKFWNRVMFPIMDVNNKVIGFGGRVLGDGMPKYLNSPETMIFDKSRNLYGLNGAKASRKKNIILCEGYMDVIALHQAGFTNGVASLGTAFTGLQASLLKRYTEEVLLCYDSDGAGVKAALRAIPILKEAGLSAKVINMKPYKDPDEFIKALGKEAFQERVDQALNSFYFEVEALEREFEMEDPEQKTKFFNEVAKKLLAFQEEIERNIYIEAIAGKYNIPFDDLRKLVNRFGSQIVVGVGREEAVRRGEGRKKKQEDGFAQTQKILLSWLAEDGSLFGKLEGIISLADFREEPYAKVAEAMFLQRRQEGKVTPAKIISSFESREEQTEVAGLFSTSLQEGMSAVEREKALNEIVYKIRRATLDYESSHATDPAQLQAIIQAQAELPKLHISL